MGIQGNLRDMALADLIQHTCQDRKTAQLAIQRAGVQALLFFKDGNLVHAQSGGETGEEVVYRILNWNDGAFTLETGVEPPSTSIARVWSSLLLEGARRIDETGQPAPPAVRMESATQLEVKPMVNFEQILGEMGAEITGYLGSALIGTDGIPVAAHPPQVKFDSRSGRPGGPGGPPPGMVPGGPGGPPPGMGPGGPGGPPPGLMGPSGVPRSPMEVAEAISAQMTMLLTLVDTTTAKIDIGEVEDNLTSTDFAYVMMRFIPGRKYFLGLTVDRRAGNLGNMRLISKMYANRIGQLLPR
jgi:predicted regulator of Ras-like GTPase activity (Roadblock/LC7/MglB family)